MGHDLGWDDDDEFDPPHHIRISASAVRAGQPVMTLVHEPAAGQVRRAWTERTVVVSWSLAGVLPFAVGDTMVERTMRVCVGEQPVLLSSSYLPAGLTGDPQGWQEVQVGQLALAGHPARSNYLEQRHRMPTHVEAKALGIHPQRIPLLVLARPYQVWAGEATTVPAGVLVRARSDLVYLLMQA